MFVKEELNLSNVLWCCYFKGKERKVISEMKKEIQISICAKTTALYQPTGMCTL